MGTDIVWHIPSQRNARIQLHPGEVYITKTRIYLAEEVVTKLAADRVAIGVCKNRAAIFLKADKAGYRIRALRKKHGVEIGQTIVQKAILEITGGDRIVRKACNHADGSIAIFL